MFCANCGAEVPQGEHRCANCGAFIAGNEAPVTMTQEPIQQNIQYQTPYQQNVQPQMPVQGFDPNRAMMQQAQPGGYYQTEYIQYDQTLSVIIKVFMLLTTIASGIFILPLAWCIPMTVVAWKSLDEGKPISMGFKVCTLIFVNLIAGICLLCLKDTNRYNQY